MPGSRSSTFKKHKLALCFLALFCLAIAFLAYSMHNLQNNIAPKYAYIAKVRNFIFLANASYTTEEKEFCLNESLRAYQQGPNLERIKVLTPLSNGAQLTEVYNSLSSELNSYLFPKPLVELWIFEALFTFFSGAGIVVPITYWASQTRKKVWSIVTVFLMVIVLILFI